MLLLQMKWKMMKMKMMMTTMKKKTRMMKKSLRRSWERKKSRGHTRKAGKTSVLFLQDSETCTGYSRTLWRSLEAH